MSGSQGYNSPVDFRIGQFPPAGDTSNAINELYTFAQQVIAAFINNCGIGPQNNSQWAALAGQSTTILVGNVNRLYVEAAETVMLGAAISLTSSNGVLQVRNANATDASRICDGFVCLQQINTGDVGEVILAHGVAPIGNITPGQRYWLSLQSGVISTIPAVGAGNVEQYLGIGIDATHLYFNTSFWLQH